MWVEIAITFTIRLAPSKIVYFFSLNKKSLKTLKILKVECYHFAYIPSHTFIMVLLRRMPFTQLFSFFLAGIAGIYCSLVNCERAFLLWFIKRFNSFKELRYFPSLVTELSVRRGPWECGQGHRHLTLLPPGHLGHSRRDLALFQVTAYCLQENQEIDGACLCKPSPHLRRTQPLRNQHLWSEDNWQGCAWNSMGTFSLSFAFLCSLGTHCSCPCTC